MLKTAYILLWFPVPTETFILREVVNLRRYGLPVFVFSLYGRWRKNLSREMSEQAADVERLGMWSLPRLIAALVHWLWRKPGETLHILRRFTFRRWRGLEKTGENLWALLAGFHLARRFEDLGIEHIHAPWAAGPATAAWVASQLTGRPYSFTARAWDIYPADALIGEKVDAATFVRTETSANVAHLKAITGAADAKFRVTYNGMPLTRTVDAPLRMTPPYKLLAMGRFVPKKGFDVLVAAAGILAGRGVPFELTFAGDGRLRNALERQARALGIADRVRFPGFLSHDSVGAAFAGADVFVMPCVVAASDDRDGIPTVLMEALMHRVPVISTPVSGIPELIRDGETGLLVPERDPVALADAIQRCLTDRDFSVRIAEQGREQVRRQFDAERNHRAVLALYATIGRP
ncbi:MAG TPA: glycosyltransferase [Beijerinckiaceae bacterium]|nr:glycosyltransferase [Beijerinckiaceae bacterium]